MGLESNLPAYNTEQLDNTGPYSCDTVEYWLDGVDRGKALRAMYDRLPTASSATPHSKQCIHHLPTISSQGPI